MIDWHHLKQLFLRLACSDTGKITISLTEAEPLPLEFIYFIEQQSLLKLRKNITTLTCQECDEGCTEQIHYHHPDTNHNTNQQPFIYCKEEGHLTVMPEQLLRWEFSFSMLAEKISQLCSCIGKVQSETPRKWLLGFITGKKHKAETFLEYIPLKGMILSVNGYSVALLEVLLIQNNKLSIDLKKLVTLADKSKQAIPGASAKQAARKQETEERNNLWREAARKIRQENTRLSINQVAEKIAQTELGAEKSPATIARCLRNLELE